ncbi:hypothetical protein ACJMK2_008607 [Sinanodonta woodiana]|uniref:Uncharacterized protein n=1 Tax=Sinanodonta woodiana TaxID=1069815 RepID=A0ABD3VNQ5_SINWO
MGLHTLYRTIDEHTKPIEGRIVGTIPTWINGSLYRNGPGIYEVGETKYNFFFDPLAIFQRFHIHNGKAFYQSRILKSDTYKANMAAKKIVVSEFGTFAVPDPCQSTFKGFLSFFGYDNTLVNYFPFEDEIYATSESNFVHRVDPETLDSLGKVNMSDYVAVNASSAHAHYDADGTLHNVGSVHGMSPEICFVRFTPKGQKEKGSLEGSEFSSGKIVASIPSSRRLGMSFVHSFAMTENYYVVVEQPLFFDFLKLKDSDKNGETALSSLEWCPSIRAKFHVVNKHTGEKINTFESRAFVVFHHCNAYEEDGHIIVDLLGYKNSDMLDAFYLSNLTSHESLEIFRRTNQGTLRRYVLPIHVDQEASIGQNMITLEGSKAKAVKTINDTILVNFDEIIPGLGLEFPQINYQKYNGRKYRYLYVEGWPNSEGKNFRLLKIDIETRQVLEWAEDGCYPCEPVFVPNPDGTEEDDGVLLSAINDIKADVQSKAFLVILDAKNMREIARAYFDLSRFPRDFHGLFKSANI